mmetsp:Transcript_25390/g.62489  ORF Transcript_25390/g.62489 Transcript_25390/m.62489 type:complete len:708 (-) Transcript_25390:824-2947(-)
MAAATDVLFRANDAIVGGVTSGVNLGVKGVTSGVNVGVKGVAIGAKLGVKGVKGGVKGVKGGVKAIQSAGGFVKKNSKYSKFAWSSRITAPVIKLDLEISCHNLPKKDLLSQADAFCVLWKAPDRYAPTEEKGVPNQLPGRVEEEIGRTEIARATVNPTFKHTFRLEYIFHQEQTYVVRLYDEDLKYATDLKEHDYLGGCIFTLGQLMGAKGCSVAKKLLRENALMVVTGNETMETCEVLEFRLSAQDLVKERSLYEQRVVDRCNPYFRVEKLNKDDQSWEVIWKSEAVKRNTSPTWKEARLPLQMICNGDLHNPVKLTIWDYDKDYRLIDYIGFVESTVSELLDKANEKTKVRDEAKGKIEEIESKRIPVFTVSKEKKRLFGFRGTKLKSVGILKILKAQKSTIPSMLKYMSGGCSLDLMIGIDCTIANEERGSDKSLHYTTSQWLNDYQAGIQKLGSIVENFARGRNSSMWGMGARINGKAHDLHMFDDKLITGKDLLQSYDRNIGNNENFKQGQAMRLKPLIEEATYLTIRNCRSRQCYTILTVFTAGNIIDLQDTIGLLCRAAEDAPISLVIIGVGNRDFSDIEKLCRTDFKATLRDARGIPIARDIISFVSFKQYGGNAAEVILQALKVIPEQLVTYFTTNGIKPLPPVPAPDYSVLIDNLSKASKSIKSKGSKGSKGSKRSHSPKATGENEGLGPNNGRQR